MLSHLGCLMMVSYKQVMNLRLLTLFSYLSLTYALPVFEAGFRAVCTVQFPCPLHIRTYAHTHAYTAYIP